MKLQCPRCGKEFVYDASLVGKTIQCSGCEAQIRMPLVDELPKDRLEEFVAEEQRKQESMQRRTERAEAAAEAKRRAKRAAREGQRVPVSPEHAYVLREVPEETVVGDRYPALRSVSLLCLVVAGFLLLVCVLVALFTAFCAVGAISGFVEWVTVVFLFLAFLGCVVTTLLLWASSELIKLFIDLADDARITRLLMKRLARREADTDKPS